MNERIKQLAVQAGIHFHNGGTLDAGPNGIAKFVMYSDMEKFAELIVKECCNIMAEYSHRPAGVVKRNVKEHFGVEE